MLNISKINPFVVKILREHGWHEERNYDMHDLLKILSCEGYVIFDYAETILKSLGGISINFDGGRDYKSPQFNFDPLFAVGEIKRLKDAERIAQEDLYPIGEMVQTFTYVGRSKKIYFGDWGELYWIGNSIEDYLNNLFDRKIKPKLLYTNPELKTAQND